MNPVTLVDVYQAHRATALSVLYHLLSQRLPMESISHKRMPSFADHEAFFDSQPYREWFLIEIPVADPIVTSTYVGMIYLSKQYEIGLAIDREHRRHRFGRIALELLMARHRGARLLANINPGNEKSIRFFLRAGFEGPIQVTFVREPRLGTQAQSEAGR